MSFKLEILFGFSALYRWDSERWRFLFGFKLAESSGLHPDLGFSLSYFSRFIIDEALLRLCFTRWNKYSLDHEY